MNESIWYGLRSLLSGFAVLPIVLVVIVVGLFALGMLASLATLAAAHPFITFAVVTPVFLLVVGRVMCGEIVRNLPESPYGRKVRDVFEFLYGARTVRNVSEGRNWDDDDKVAFDTGNTSFAGNETWEVPRGLLFWIGVLVVLGVLGILCETR
jgi:hypothetical protein